MPQQLHLMAVFLMSSIRSLGRQPISAIFMTLLPCVMLGSQETRVDNCQTSVPQTTRVEVMAASGVTRRCRREWVRWGRCRSMVAGQATANGKPSTQPSLAIAECTRSSSGHYSFDSEAKIFMSRTSKVLKFSLPVTNVLAPQKFLMACCQCEVFYCSMGFIFAHWSLFGDSAVWKIKYF